MEYLLLQIIGLVFVAFVLSRIILRYKKDKFTFRETLFWAILWILVGIVVVLPGFMSFLAKILGVGRGVDVIIYLGLILLFYLNFKSTVRMEKIEQDISKVVKEITLRKK